MAAGRRGKSTSKSNYFTPEDYEQAAADEARKGVEAAQERAKVILERGKKHADALRVQREKQDQAHEDESDVFVERREIPVYDYRRFVKSQQ
jgi:uncharacterized protein YpmB